MIRLQEIDRENWRERLQVSEEQKKYVANTTVILARAYAFRDFGSRALLICDGEQPVGMVLFYECPEEKCYVFSELLIDERYQHKGYGREASKMVLDIMRAEKKYDKVDLCYIDGNEAAKSLYLSLGFYLTGEADEDEIIMEKIL